MRSPHRGSVVEHSFTAPVNHELNIGRISQFAETQRQIFKDSGKGFFSFIISIYLMVSCAQIIMGSYYLNDCPMGQHVPKYLTAAGCMGILHVMLPFLWPEYEQIAVTIRAVAIIWFFIGTSLIFYDFRRLYNPTNEVEQCNIYLYRFAFWISVAEYVSIFILIIFMCTLYYLKNKV